MLSLCGPFAVLLQCSAMPEQESVNNTAHLYSNPAIVQYRQSHIPRYG
ncbi:hypothetical protein [Paenibacillus sp. sgz5001063]